MFEVDAESPRHPSCDISDAGTNYALNCGVINVLTDNILDGILILRDHKGYALMFGVISFIVDWTVLYE